MYNDYIGFYGIPVPYSYAWLATVMGYSVTVFQFQATVGDFLDSSVPFYDVAPAGLDILDIQELTFDLPGVNRSESLRRSEGENLGLGITKNTVVYTDGQNDHAFVQINYDAIRTRYTNHEAYGVILTQENPPRALGLSTGWRPVENVGTRVDIIRPCFVQNVWNFTDPNCLPKWKYFMLNFLDVEVSTTIAESVDIITQNLPIPFAVDEPSSEWPEHPMNWDYYVDVMGESS